MKNDKLIDAIGRVDDDLIEEAETVTNPEGLPEKTGSKILHGPWKELLPSAAVILLVVGLSLSVFTWGGFGSSSSSSTGPDSSTAYEESTTEASSDVAEEVESEEDTEGNSEIPIETEAAGEEAEEAEEVQESASEPDLPGPLPAYIGEVELLRGGYTWSKGSQTVIADAAFILDCEDLVPVVQMTDGAVTLEFEEAPDDLTAICYPGDAWGLTDLEVASVELTVQGTTVYLPDSTSDWIVVVTATWDSWQSWSGACEYWFVAEP